MKNTEKRYKSQFLELYRLDINMGSILENIIAQELKANGFILNYFDSKKYGEIDFVLQNGMKFEVDLTGL